MANIDNANGFYLDYSMVGHAETVQGHVYKAAAALTITRGDALIEDESVAGKISIAEATDVLLLGVSVQTSVWTATQMASIASTLNGYSLNFYPALPWYVFNGQVETADTYALTYRYKEADINGGTGVMEVDLAASTNVLFIIGEDPNSEIGAHTRVKFVINYTSYLPGCDAT